MRRQHCQDRLFQSPNLLILIDFWSFTTRRKASRICGTDGVKASKEHLSWCWWTQFCRSEPAWNFNYIFQGLHFDCYLGFMTERLLFQFWKSVHNLAWSWLLACLKIQHLIAEAPHSSLLQKVVSNSYFLEVVWVIHKQIQVWGGSAHLYFQIGLPFLVF